MTDAAAQELRKQIEVSLRDNDWRRARAAATRLWQLRPSAATARHVIACFERMRESVPLQKCRVGLLRSFTLEPTVPILRAAALVHGLDLTIQMGPLNAYAQQILDHRGDLHTQLSDVVILAVHTRDIAPELWAGLHEKGGPTPQQRAEEVDAHFRTLVDSFRQRSNATLVIHTLEKPPHAFDGILDSQRADGQIEAIEKINIELRNIARRYSDVYVLDYDALAARFGRERWTDERLWLTAKLPISPAALLPLADEWLQFLCPALGRLSKVLVTDLDNTLWKGVIGEDGMDGIQIGPAYAGAPFAELQRALLGLRNRGILLAIASKNNRDDAYSALSLHPNMLLRPEHFVAERINWQNKPQNLREIAAELNVGIDSLAFLDDNPVERDLVRLELPEVTIIELPDDPSGYAQAVQCTPELQRLRVSDEDVQRSKFYAERRERNEARANHQSLESFYHWLEQKVEIAPLTDVTAARIAQLTQKTNQFNATTKRYTEQQIIELAASSGCEIFSVRAKDHFGDNGIVGVLISRIANENCEIDSFILSCRVISRTIETAMLTFLLERCRTKGVRTVHGCIVSTPKNEPVRTLYERHGFTRVSGDEDHSLWALEVENATVPLPAWIELTVTEDRTVGDFAYR